MSDTAVKTAPTEEDQELDGARIVVEREFLPLERALAALRDKMIKDFQYEVGGRYTVLAMYQDVVASNQALHAELEAAKAELANLRRAYHEAPPVDTATAKGLAPDLHDPTDDETWAPFSGLDLSTAPYKEGMRG